MQDKYSEFKYTSSVKVPQSALWEWHMRNGAFERLSPPWQKVDLLEFPQKMHPGSKVRLRVKFGFLWKEWIARVDTFDPPNCFSDVQESGPFKYWYHRHEMSGEGDGNSLLSDIIKYRLLFGVDKFPLLKDLVVNDLNRLFRFRHLRTSMDLERFGGELPGEGKRVLITGITGLIGSRLSPFLKTIGYEVRGLSRHPRGTGMFGWDPSREWIDPEALQGVDAVIHLAGANIASSRWTEKRKQEILNSRIDGTRCLVAAIGRMQQRPSVLIGASGVNVYQSGPDIHDEEGSAGSGFLGEVCRKWEEEVAKAEAFNVRTVSLRTGVVLDPSGGALGKMLPAYRLGMGGRIGSGKQGFPWIAIDDLLDIYEFTMRTPGLTGPVNAVAPDMLQQREFSRILASVLGRPDFLPVPGKLIKLLFGQMGEEALLADLRIQPVSLLGAGYKFRFERLKPALAFLLGRSCQ